MTDPQRTPPSKKTLAAAVGAPVAAILLSVVPSLEGTILRGYRDPIGIVTACTGHTLTAVLGKPYTREECTKLLQEDLLTHADGVLACTPSLAGQTGPLSAAVSFAFNVGTGAYCRSTMARKFNAGDVQGGCMELYRWTYAGGKQLAGLVRRRGIEADLCLGKAP
ncbi:lysozyme [Variovorax sp. GB1P17]|uniref:lysozyme n=1 Tax=Variovorax sp. GB1P17 TaxID=3443740 RepID=UPI003F452BB6